MISHGPCTLKGPIARDLSVWERANRKARNKKSSTPIRTELVNRVRAEIAAGTYDTPERWEAALETMAQRVLFS